MASRSSKNKNKTRVNSYNYGSLVTQSQIDHDKAMLVKYSNGDKLTKFKILHAMLPNDRLKFLSRVKDNTFKGDLAETEEKAPINQKNIAKIFKQQDYLNTKTKSSKANYNPFKSNRNTLVAVTTILILSISIFVGALITTNTDNSNALAKEELVSKEPEFESNIEEEENIMPTKEKNPSKVIVVPQQAKKTTLDDFSFKVEAADNKEYINEVSDKDHVFEMYVDELNKFNLTMTGESFIGFQYYNNGNLLGIKGVTAFLTNNAIFLDYLDSVGPNSTLRIEGFDIDGNFKTWNYKFYSTNTIGNDGVIAPVSDVSELAFVVESQLFDEYNVFFYTLSSVE